MRVLVVGLIQVREEANCTALSLWLEKGWLWCGPFSLPRPAVSGAGQCLIANYYSSVATGILDRIREVDILCLL